MVSERSQDIESTYVSYLLFKYFSGGPVRTYPEALERLEKPLFTYAVDYWGYHASACSACSPKLLDLLTNPEWVSMVVQLCARFSRIRGPWIPNNQYLCSTFFRPSHNAFHIVGSYGLNNLVKELLTSAKNIDPDQQDHRGQTPESYAAQNGHTEIVKAPLSDGRVDPHRQDKRGKSPLSWIAANEREIIKSSPIR